MIDRKKVIAGLESQLDDLSKYADADEVLTLTQNQAKDVLALLKEQKAKQPVHAYKEFKEHDWYRNEDDEIDEFAFDAGYHNGPTCKRCYYSFCIHCDPDGWNKEPCIIDEYKCQKCKKHISKGTKYCSNCGQEVKWDE